MLVLAFDSKTLIEAAAQILTHSLHFLNLPSLTLVISLEHLNFPLKVMTVLKKTVFVLLAFKLVLMSILKSEFKLFDFIAELRSFRLYHFWLSHNEGTR